ncbi:MAG: hypothetical protein ACLFQX_03965 [Candidatus Kapaibacterium sp.]
MKFFFAIAMCLLCFACPTACQGFEYSPILINAGVEANAVEDTKDFSIINLFGIVSGRVSGNADCSKFGVVAASSDFACGLIEYFDRGFDFFAHEYPDRTKDFEKIIYDIERTNQERIASLELEKSQQSTYFIAAFAFTISIISVIAFFLYRKIKLQHSKIEDQYIQLRDIHDKFVNSLNRSLFPILVHISSARENENDSQLADHFESFRSQYNEMLKNIQNYIEKEKNLN